MHCEVQVLTTDLAEVRHAMHEVYKYKRATDAQQLHADVAKPPEVGVDFKKPWTEEKLFSASMNGCIKTVKEMLSSSDRGGDGGGGGGGDDGATSGLDVNWKTQGQGEDADQPYTPLSVAAEKGHLPVVLELLKHKADPNGAGLTAQPRNALWRAVQKGHFDIVNAVLEMKPALSKNFKEEFEKHYVSHRVSMGAQHREVEWRDVFEVVQEYIRKNPDKVMP